MLKIEDILSGNFSSYPEETQIYMKNFAEKLKNYIKTELINDKADKMLKDIDKSKDYFIDVLTEILENGCKGYNTMSTKALLNIYLNVKTEEDFINLIEKISNEVNCI
ncbi:hypothetical protein AAGC94_03000 [Clostridium sporogenes]|uniref:Uncharacterized protein n=2 Tax=Clostridium sporogenes TaxID=1509 RepID=A0A7X5P7S3_CLOSG|nr:MULTISPECIES: hypothetical protein [Clostridium]AJD32218.1 hypothetical protein T258_140 [Clostridium botulinum Prevot_594]AVP59515.1 hypothetical protein C7M79_01840 [Clostridium botulinum]AKC62088.1 hypothetical protein CLSPO_c13680 [Clostridium sporogenes]AKJ89376.1 hypothetical protein CLSPOx_06910 [Clostridium sporogenes]EHN16139.1 hypothetical protein IYC_03903 [Clostridium sporogenes PA 3679]